MVVDFQHQHVPVELAKKEGSIPRRQASKILRNATSLLVCNGLGDARLNISRFITTLGFDL
jgi:hypothetical protein